MEPRIIIDGWEQGFLEDITTPARNGFNFGAGIDIHKEPGVLHIAGRLDNQSIKQNPGNINLTWMTQYGSSGTVYGFNSTGTGYIHEWRNTAVSIAWGTVREYNGGATAGGMTEFNNKLYWAANDDLGSFDGTTWTNSTGSFSKGTSVSWPTSPTGIGAGWHPMAVLGTKLCVGDGNYLYTLDDAGVSNGSAIALPSGELIKCSAIYNGLLYFGTVKKNVNEGKVYYWDGTSSEPEPVINLNEGGIHALKVWKNKLYIFAGMSGNLYKYNGATIEKAETIPGIGVNIPGFVNPGAAMEYGGKLVFGLSNTITNTIEDYSGIYSIGNKNETLPEALTMPYIVSNGPLGSAGTIRGLTFYSLAPSFSGISDKETFHVSYKDPNASGTTTFINQISGVALDARAFLESQVYDVSDGEQKGEIQGVEVVARPLESVGEIGIRYKKDNAFAWTSLGTINYTNQDKILFGQIGVAKTFQVRLDFITHTVGSPYGSSGYDPEVFSVKIY